MPKSNNNSINVFSRFSSLKPNVTHKILKELEDIGKIQCLITQNVDNLHSKAGSKNVIELHGTSYRVICLNCDHKICRYELQKIFQKLNPSMTATTQMIRPDGDVELLQVCVCVCELFIIYIHILGDINDKTCFIRHKWKILKFLLVVTAMEF